MCVGVAEGIGCVWGIGVIAVCVYRRRSFAVVSHVQTGNISYNAQYSLTGLFCEGRSLEVTVTCGRIKATPPHINALAILKLLQEFLFAIHVYAKV